MRCAVCHLPIEPGQVWHWLARTKTEKAEQRGPTVHVACCPCQSRQTELGTRRTEQTR